ncbi:MAG: N-6 DNA methylase [Candidatus Cloacimonadota bacterium]|nr:N-6 DNA methylase [Candidatus Cloacimonadota bacterium]
MNRLNDIKNWKNQFGLLPINLFSSNTENKYILLNGGYGDFCVDLNSDKNPIDYYSFAWSSNTKNFITLKNEDVYLYNWLKEKEEKYSVKVVQENLTKFYDYLLKDSYRSEFDITPFIIDIYRRLRVETGEDNEGINAINQLLLLLVAIENGDDFNNINLTDWGLQDNITPLPNLAEYIQTLKNGSKSVNGNKLYPNADLILRHSAGQLFQEAQKEAIFYNRQLGLFGGYLSDYDLKTKLYSSLHYTPSFLARSIVEYSLSKLNINEKDNLKILDPACGSSEFLLEVLKQLKSLGYTGNVEINGWDISETAINISKFLLNYEKKEWGERLTVSIEKVDNSLTKNWNNEFDLILMNPPFLSWELMGKSDREIISEILGESTRKKPNLASAFVYKSKNHLKENGIIGTVIPSSILLMDSYKKLRDNIKEQLSLLLVGKLGNYVFEDALTDVSILVGRKPKSNEMPLLLWSKNEKEIITEAFRDLRKVNYGNIPYIKENKSYNIYIPDKYPDNDNWKVISYKEQELKKHLEKFVLLGELKAVTDIFNVKQGVRTGNNKVFKISKHYYEQLSKNEKKYFRPVIDNESIKNGKIKILNYVWYPYNADGLVIMAEQELENEVPYFYQNVLLPNKERLINRARKDINSWWILSEHRAWLREKTKKIVSTEFGKSGSFAFDEKGEFVVERGNGWIPKKEFENINYYYFYLSVFNSPFFDKLLSIYSKELLNGYDLGKKYTADIPIPEITEKLTNSFVFNKLVDFGKQISSGEMFYFEIIDDYLKEHIYKV